MTLMAGYQRHWFPFHGVRSRLPCRSSYAFAGMKARAQYFSDAAQGVKFRDELNATVTRYGGV
jgi:hypothetical protein